MSKQSKRKSGQRYAELLCDFMFKRMFGSEANKDVLIGFLNMILDDAKIVDVDFIQTEHYGLTEQDRKAVFDISCKCQDGSTLIIEMQKGYQEYFRKRAVYYTSYPICEQGRLAKENFIKEHQCKDDGAEFRWDYNLKPVTVVAILNFMFDHDPSWPEDRYHSSYRLREDCTNEIMTDVIRFSLSLDVSKSTYGGLRRRLTSGCTCYVACMKWWKFLKFFRSRNSGACLSWRKSVILRHLS